MRTGRSTGAAVMVVAITAMLTCSGVEASAHAALVVPVAVTATIPVGDNPLGVAVDATRNLVYVTNNSSQSVSVIDGQTNTVVDTIPIPTQPFGTPQPVGIAVDSVLNKIYVANNGPAASGDTVSVIDGATRTVVGSVTLAGAYHPPNFIAIDSGLHHVYVTGGMGVVTIDAITDAPVAFTTWPPPRLPRRVAVDPVTHRVYVSNSPGANGSIAVVDGATGGLVTSIPFGGLFEEPEGLAVDPVAHDIYVASHGSGNGSSVWVVDGATNTIQTTIGGMAAPSDVAVDTSTRAVFAANVGAGGGGMSTTVIDAATNTVAGSVMVGLSPTAVAVNSTTHTAYVANVGNDTVSVITVTRTMPSPACPRFAVTTHSLPAGGVGRAYSATLRTCGASVAPKWKKLSPLPKGLKLAGRTGVISGVPKQPGTTRFTVRAEYKVKRPHEKPVRNRATTTLSIRVT
jgi:YVTN family beta-propeller protein